MIDDESNQDQRGVRGFADQFEGHFPGHTMQRVRTPDGRYLYNYVSPEVRETFGLDPDTLMSGEGVQHDWLHPEDRSRFVAALERSAETLEMLDQEVRVASPDGGYKWVRSIGHPRREPDGTVIWDGVALDVTDRREALDALERALSQAKRDEVSDGRMAAIAARDVSHPLKQLGEAVDRLRQIQAGDAPAEEIAAIRNVVMLYDGFFKAFTATRDLVAAGREQIDDVRSSGITVRDRREIADEAVETLTRRQRDVLRLIQAGASNRDIAGELGISEGTVKLHVSAILRALGVKNRTMAAAYPLSD